METDERVITAEGLAELEQERTLSVLDCLPEAISLIAPDGVEIHSNTPSFKMFEKIEAPNAGTRPLSEFEWNLVDVDGNPLPYAKHPFEITRVTGEAVSGFDVGFPGIDGTRVWHRLSTRRFGDDGPPYAVIASYNDVSAQRQAERGMRQANQLFAQAFEHAPLGMAIVDLEGRFLRVNPSMCRLLGYDEQALLSLTVLDVTHPEDQSQDSELLRQEAAGEVTNYQVEKRYLHADGSVIECILSVATVSDENGVAAHTIGQVQDVTEQRSLERQLQHLADRDYLTGLLNRRRFEHELERQIERCARHGERAALLLLDIDYFKVVNDTGGHAAGDRLLRHVGRILSERIRRSDLTARIGGDEFAAILIDANVETSVKVAEELVGSLRGLDDVNATASVGIALIRPDDKVDAALARADRAMYAVKRAGRDGVVVDQAR